MSMNNTIYKLRTAAKLSQEQFACLFDVSRQSVQKWEKGTAVPELSKLIEISKRFGISLDALILNRDNRMIEDLEYNHVIKPNYSNFHAWEFFGASAIVNEYMQAVDEGLDVAQYKDLFYAVSKLPVDEKTNELGNVLFKIISDAKQKSDYPYIEPSELDAIRCLRKGECDLGEADKSQLENKLYGAWMGRICGCMLGKTVEGIKSNEFVSFLKETDNYPMHRYIYKKEITDEICNKYDYPFAQRFYADEIDGMPADDDTNYTVLAQIIIDRYGRNFTPYDVSRQWIESQSIEAYCTAERVAFRNFINGYEPPYSAIYKNPYREWIGAQIRGDYFGYINPGNPELAAEMAWRDASISHIKNGIYGEMFVSAMIAAAAVTNDIEKIILSGLAQIPCTSRLYESVLAVLANYKNGTSEKDCFKAIHNQYDEYTDYGWCHTISNAMIVTAALLYGKGDYGRSICMAVETGFDTDCNGATVGSVLGMAGGIDRIPEYWTKPINNTLYTEIFGLDSVKVSDCVRKTLEHIL